MNFLRYSAAITASAMLSAYCVFPVSAAQDFDLDPPSDVMAAYASVTDTSAAIVWNKPKEYTDDIAYEVYINGKFEAETDKLYYTAENLSPNTNYDVEVRSKEDKEVSDFSEPVHLTTKPQSEVLNVLDYGAKGDGKTIDTSAIQAAINDCPENGTVYLPEDKTFLSGAIDLKSDMTLCVDGTLQGTSSAADYCSNEEDGLTLQRFNGIEYRTYKSLINAGTINHESDENGKYIYNCENIVLNGKGEIKGGGAALAKSEGYIEKNPNPNRDEETGIDLSDKRGRLVSFYNCQNVYMSDLSFSNPSSWTIHMVYSDSIASSNIKVNTSGIRNGDGWDPDSSTNCMIFGSTFNTGDDCIAIKSGRNSQGDKIARPTENIRIFNCKANGGLGMAIGTEMSGGINNVTLSDCEMTGTRYGFEVKPLAERGGYIKNISVLDSSIDRIWIHNSDITYNNGFTPAETKPVLENMTFKNLKISGNSYNGSSKTVLDKPIILEGFSQDDAGTDYKLSNALFENIEVGESENVFKNVSMKYCKNITFTNVRQMDGQNPTFVMTNCDNDTIVYDKAPMANVENRIEAESMTLNGYEKESNQYASGGYCIKTSKSGTAEACYIGEDKIADISITYFDENDGTAKYKLYVNDEIAGEWSADKDLGSANPDDKSKTVQTIKNISLKKGDIIKLEGSLGKYDPARVDFIEISESKENSVPDAPSCLLTNELENPLNIEEPSFRWVVNDKDDNEIQTAYEIIVTDEISGNTVWDSGKVESSEQSNIKYEGNDLQGGHPYSWQVKTWDAEDAESVYSEKSYFSTGILNNDWNAKWISDGTKGASAKEGKYNHFWYVRGSTQLENKEIKKVLGYFSAAHDYDLYVNGEEIGRGQSFDYASEMRYQGWDITKNVSGNSLTIGALVRTYGPGQGRAALNAGFIGKVIVYYTDGTSTVFSTNSSSWKTSGNVPFSGTSIRNSEGDFIEKYDAQNAQEDFSKADYDVKSWSEAVTLGSHPMEAGSDNFTNLIPETSKSVTDIVYPVSVKKLSDGTTIADFGKVIPARPMITFKNGKAGNTYTIQAGYKLNSDSTIAVTAAETQNTNMTWQYTQKDGEQTYNAWDHLGFRYLSIPDCGENFTEQTICAKMFYAEMPQNMESTFESSNETLNNVYDLMKRSAMYSMQNSFVDTPTREKGQFLQDSVNISEASMSTLYERAISKKAIEQFIKSADRYWTDDEGNLTGQLNSVYPNGDGKRDIPDFTINFPYWVYNYYMNTGDKSIVEETYKYIKAITEYISKNTDSSTGLVTKLEGGDYYGKSTNYQYGIVDWPSSGRFGYDWKNTTSGARTTVNMLSKRAYDCSAELAEVLGKSEDAQSMRERSSDLKSAINKKLIASNGVYCDGLKEDGTQSGTKSQHSTSYALAFGIAPDDKISDMTKYVGGLGMKQGPMTADILIKGLLNSDNADDALNILTNKNDYGWAKVLENGGSFTWEEWSLQSKDASMSHGWGATAVSDIIRGFLGVKITEPGASRIEISPSAGTLEAAKGEVVTERGLVEVRYSSNNKELKGFKLSVNVPDNVVADIVLDYTNYSSGWYTYANDSTHKVIGEKNSNGQKITVGSGITEIEFYTDPNSQPNETLSPTQEPTQEPTEEPVEYPEFTDGIEAEDMRLSGGYTIETANSYASGGKNIKTVSSGSTAEAVYQGESKTANIRVTYIAENDGQSPYKLYVNNKLIYSWNGLLVDNDRLEDEIIKNVSLFKGDVIKLEGSKNKYAAGRIDCIKIEDCELIEISDKVINENSIEYSVNVNDDTESTLLAALYNSEGALIGIKNYENEKNPTVKFETEGKGVLKLFLWDSLKQMQPKTEAITDTFEYVQPSDEETIMKNVYNELKTPYKYGMVVTGTDDEGTIDVDCQGIFRYNDKWYMTYVSHNSNSEYGGYRTNLASSENLLDWKYEGVVFQNSKDYPQCAAFPALQDVNWGGSGELEQYDGKYWWTTMEGAVKGYEGEPMNIGTLSSTDPSNPQSYVHEDGLLLTTSDEDVRTDEKQTLYKSNIIHDTSKTTGYEYVMYYNAKNNSKQKTERIFMAVSNDMKNWKRYGDSYVLYNEGYQITGDPQVVKMGDIWVMNFFTYKGGSAHAYDSFAISKDLVNWTMWDGEPLTDSTASYDSKHAHKPWVIKYDGVVYHFYCARSNDGSPRGIALSTSVDLKK